MTPATETELAEMIRASAGQIVIQGGGTRTLERREGQTINTSGLSGIQIYEPGALTLVARAGTRLSEVEAALSAEGQRFPFEVPDMRGLLGTSGESTIGGVVAANASGPRRVQAGACRDSLIGVRFVNGEGTIIKNGGRVMKNVTGYDLVKLMAGSWGQLGVLTEVSFKVLPAPESTATLMLRNLDDAQSVAAMSAALASPFEISAAAHLPGAGTFLRIEGFANSVAYRAERLRKHLAPYGPVEMCEESTIWAKVRDVQPFHAVAGDVWRLSIKPSDAPGLIARAGAMSHLMDWGGGLLWLLIEPGTDLRSRLGAFQGHATRVRGDAVSGPTFHPEVPAIARLMDGIRQKFDPRGLFSGVPA